MPPSTRLGRSLALLVLLAGAGACLSGPTYQDHPVDCARDADCAWMGSTATCAPAGFCVLGAVDAQDGGADAGDGGQDGGRPDGGPGDGGPSDGGDGGWVCPEPCAPPLLEIVEPAPDAAVSSPLVLWIKVSPGDLPVDTVHCNLPSPYSAWSDATTNGDGYRCSLALDEVPIGSDFGAAATAVDVMGHPSTEIRWFSRKD